MHTPNSIPRLYADHVWMVRMPTTVLKFENKAKRKTMFSAEHTLAAILKFGKNARENSHLVKCARSHTF